MKIGVAIIVGNVTPKLENCLGRLKWADEIVLVHDGSNPRAIDDIGSSNPNVKVYFRPFDNFANQKNFALSMTSNEWILSIDSDEEVSPALEREIQALPEDPTQVAFMIGFITFFGKRAMRFGPFLKEYHVRLFRRQLRFSGTVHEVLLFGNARVGRLRSPILHYTYDGVEQFLEKVNRYTTLEAAHMGYTSVSTLRALTRIPWRFIKYYLLRLGFLDGWLGLLNALVLAIYPFIVVVKTLDQNQDMKKG